MDRSGYEQLDRIERKLDVIIKKSWPNMVKDNQIKEEK